MFTSRNSDNIVINSGKDEFEDLVGVQTHISVSSGGCDSGSSDGTSRGFGNDRSVGELTVVG